MTGKAPITPDEGFVGIRAALTVAGTEFGQTPEELLASTATFALSTTKATNAILEGATARRALLVNAGFSATAASCIPSNCTSTTRSPPCPGSSLTRCPSASTPKALWSDRSTRRRPSDAGRASDSSGRGHRRLPAVVDRQSHVRAVGGRAHSAPSAGGSADLWHNVNPVVRGFRQVSEQSSTLEIDTSAAISLRSTQPIIGKKGSVAAPSRSRADSAVRFLAENTYVTGHVLVVDGVLSL